MGLYIRPELAVVQETPGKPVVVADSVESELPLEASAGVLDTLNGATLIGIGCHPYPDVPAGGTEVVQVGRLSQWMDHPAARGLQGPWE